LLILIDLLQKSSHLIDQQSIGTGNQIGLHGLPTHGATEIEDVFCEAPEFFAGRRAHPRLPREEQTAQQADDRNVGLPQHVVLFLASPKRDDQILADT
jgi:hypothetical protein